MVVVIHSFYIWIEWEKNLQFGKIYREASMTLYLEEVTLG